MLKVNLKLNDAAKVQTLSCMTSKLENKKV